MIEADREDATVGGGGATAVEPSDLRVLQVASSSRSFFEQQVAALEELGVECETVVVPYDDAGSRGAREYLAFYLRELGRSLESFDLVHANYGLLGPLALAQPVRPVVLTLWGSDIMGPAWLNRTSRVSARLSDEVIVPSTPMSDAVDVPHEVIPFGVDIDRFRPISRQTARARVGWDTDERIVLFPYDPERPVKNYPLAERVVERVPDATLKTVSGVPHERVPDYLNASDALLVTSERESGPMVVREAAACNVPVVSRDVGFVRDVLSDVANSAVADGEADLATHLAAVLDADERANGREVLEELDPDRAARRVLDTYRSALR